MLYKYGTGGGLKPDWWQIFCLIPNWDPLLPSVGVYNIYSVKTVASRSSA